MKSVKRTNIKRCLTKHRNLLCAAFLVAVFFLCTLRLKSDNDVLSTLGPTPIRRTGVDVANTRWMDNSTRYNYNFRVITEPRMKVCPNEVFAIVMSAPSNFERRRAIRNTWAKDLTVGNESQLIFALGRSANSDRAIDLNYEMATHQDIVVFDFEDSYNNSTLKTVLSVKYASRCQASYFLKADDDTYVNVEQLFGAIRLIEKAFNEPFMAGQVHAGEKPHRALSKWSVDSEEYPENFLPTYISGNLYVISGSLLPSVAATAAYTRHLHLEDVFMTGIVATKLTIPRVSLEGIWDRKRSTTYNCAYNNFVSGHYVEPSLMEAIHNDRQLFVQSCTSFYFFSWCSCVPRIAEIYVI